METLRLINGNKQPMIKTLPRLFIHGSFNDVALAHITENTGLVFTKHWNGMEAQPVSSDQIVRLFLTYNFKTRYFDNWNSENTIHLKSDHHVGFDVDSICAYCVERNNIRLGAPLDADALLSC